jgi:purine nucleosidase
MTQKVLFDTDIGSDIDDAVALAYLLAQAECELLGITTVTGEAVRRAQLASALCLAAGQDIPIYPGREAPLLVRPLQPLAPQAAALGRWRHMTDFPRGEAVAFLRQTIRAHPGEVTLLATGPLTNVAALFALDEEIPSLLKGLVLMCGMFASRHKDGGLLEWNAMLDPHAAAIVYRSAVRLHRSIGLDVTEKVTMAAGEVRQRFQAPRLLPVLDFAEVWFQDRPLVTFHDPLAATTLFDADVCGFERGQVEIELATERLAGLTRWKPASDGPHEVALRVDPEGFFKHYFSVVSGSAG